MEGNHISLNLDQGNAQYNSREFKHINKLLISVFNVFVSMAAVFVAVFYMSDSESYSPPFVMNFLNVEGTNVTCRGFDNWVCGRLVLHKRLDFTGILIMIDSSCTSLKKGFILVIYNFVQPFCLAL